MVHYRFPPPAVHMLATVALLFGGFTGKYTVRYSQSIAIIFILLYGCRLYNIDRALVVCVSVDPALVCSLEGGPANMSFSNVVYPMHNIIYVYTVDRQGQYCCVYLYLMVYTCAISL